MNPENQVRCEVRPAPAAIPAAALDFVRLKLTTLPEVSCAYFFTLDLSASPQVFYRGDELTDLGDRSVSLRLVAARRPNRAMSVMHERYASGADTGADMLRHEGEEGGVVVRGRIELTIGGETRVLGPGDAYYFTSAIPHRFRNPGSEPCEIISASTPPTF